MQERELDGTDALKVLKDFITKSPKYHEDLVKNMLTNITEEKIQRKKLIDEAYLESKFAKETTFELERLKLQLKSPNHYNNLNFGK